jgi:hypothetical protein
MRKTPRNVLTILAAGLLAACSSHPGSSGGLDSPGAIHAVDTPAKVLMRFGVEEDGSLTRAKVVAGLKMEFAAADTNRDGVLERDEMNAVNERRWKKDGEAASLLVDWNRDGVVDFSEFATTDLSLFEQYDFNGDGVLTNLELRGIIRKLHAQS